MLRSLIALLILGSSSALSAQNTHHVVPSQYAKKAGESSGPLLFAGYVRYLQVFENKTLGFGRKVITDLAYRRDAVISGTYPLGTKKRTIKMGYTRYTPKTMPYRFSQVPLWSMTTVLSGTIHHPVAKPRLGPQPWSVFIKLKKPFVFLPALGNFVMEVEGPPSISGRWGVDSTFSFKGIRGSARAWHALGCKTSGKGHMVQDSRSSWIPGRHALIAVSSLPPLSKVLFHIMGPLRKKPLDLTGIGAPGCLLWITQWYSLVPLPVFYSNTYRQNIAVAQYAIPNIPTLAGKTIGSQWLALDNPPGFTLGLTLSNTWQITFGAEDMNTFASRLLYSTSKNDPFGLMSVGETGAITRFTVR